MRFIIKHEIRGRIRIRILQNRMSFREADMLEYYFRSQENVLSVRVQSRTCGLVVCYRGDREILLHLLQTFRYENAEAPEEYLQNSGRALNESYKEKLIQKAALRLGSRLFLPAPVRYALAVGRSLKFIREGIRTLAKGRLEVAVLDATAITASLLRADYDTAGSIMFLLGICEILEEWTHKKSERNLSHEEMHSRVEYVVAHGISSWIGAQRVLIGSYHFVFEDKHCSIPEGKEPLFDELPLEYTHLYLCMEQKLAAVICIEDPLRPEAEAALSALRKTGFEKIVMMTGDSDRTARAIAKRVGVDEYYAEVLPEDKTRFVEAEKQAGRKVIMIGDGINDSPALAAADVGIAISEGAELAREIADITVGADDLMELVLLKRLSDRLMRQIHGNYRVIVGFNTALILLGIAGILPPTMSALLHNTSTLLFSLRSMRNLL